MSRERVEQLLATRATQRLSGEESMELQRLLAEARGSDGGDRLESLEVDDFDLAAAAIDRVLETDESASEELPAQLQAKVAEQAAAFFTQADATSDSVAQFARPQPQPRASSALPWVAAAAAALIAVVGWWPRLQTEPVKPPDAPMVAEAPPSPAERRASLIAAETALQLDWQATEDPAATGAAGDIVWSDDLQQGYMRISGLAANDPTIEQYQLWIFSPDQDERYPVDGGVFDFPTGTSEAVVAIDPKIEVTGPVLFAVTVEKPGGVVVSSRERIVLLAQA